MDYHEINFVSGLSSPLVGGADAVGGTRRSSCRKTWLSFIAKWEKQFDLVINYRFILARPEETFRGSILQEAKDHNDLIILNKVEDRYETLNVRTRVMIPYIVRKFCYTWLFKLDDDYYVREGAFSIFVQPRTANQLVKNPYLMMGIVVPNMPINKDPKSKKYFDRLAMKGIDSFFWRNCKYYPKFAMSSYMLTRPVTKYIEVSAPILRLMTQEDVSVGFWTMTINVAKWRLPGMEYASCPFQKPWNVIHMQTEYGYMTKIYENIVAGRDPCDKINLKIDRRAKGRRKNAVPKKGGKLKAKVQVNVKQKPKKNT